MSADAGAVAFLASVLAIDDIGDSVDLLYDRIDERLSAGDLAFCNTVLEAADPQQLGITRSLGLLTITLPAAPRLSERARFRERAETWMKTTECAGHSAHLLEGL